MVLVPRVKFNRFATKMLCESAEETSHNDTSSDISNCNCLTVAEIKALGDLVQQLDAIQCLDQAMLY